MSEIMKYIDRSPDGKSRYQKEWNDYQDEEVAMICESFFQIINHKLTQDKRVIEENMNRSSGDVPVETKGWGVVFPLEQSESEKRHDVDSENDSEENKEVTK
tara:strand:+ start:1478 stop:1783 length:306 start_codon:yes stop_codon:yes gene_type:complete